MFQRKPRPVAEHEAQGEVARVYHEIRQTLRVTGVNLNFRTWAGFPRFFPMMWRAMQPIAASEAFERAGDRVRARAAELSLRLPALEVPTSALGESQRFQLARALALYHYINPKLLVFTNLVRRGIEERPGRPDRSHALDPHRPLGPAPSMPALEMVDAPPADRRLARLFHDIRTTLDLPSINSDYRTLALWPGYLDAGWKRLKPIVKTAAYAELADEFRQDALEAAAALPSPAGITSPALMVQGEDAASVARTTRRFERLLPGLILNIALFTRDWVPADRLAASPFPAEPPGRAVRSS